MQQDITRHIPPSSTPDTDIIDLVAIDAGQLVNWRAIDVQLCRISRLSWFCIGVWCGGLWAAAAWGVVALWLVGTLAVGAAVVYVTREEY
jgi:hypothetical protein